EGGEEHDRAAGVVVDGLGVDVLAGELHAEARARGGAGDGLPDAPLPLLQQLGFLNGIHEERDFGFVGFRARSGRQATVLPSLRRTRSACSATMRTPLPL